MCIQLTHMRACNAYMYINPFSACTSSANEDASALTSALCDKKTFEQIEPDISTIFLLLYLFQSNNRKAKYHSNRRHC